MDVRAKSLKKTKGAMAILAVAVMAIASIWAAGVPEKVLEPAESTSRLVSIQEVPSLDKIGMRTEMWRQNEFSVGPTRDLARTPPYVSMRSIIFCL